jgi:hypothetical protein
MRIAWILGIILMAIGTRLLEAGQVVSGFKLVDQNPSSVRFAAKVSPRDYLLQVSGYYFGEAG